MIDFVSRRGGALALVVLVLIADGIAQNSISYSFAFGALRGQLAMDLTRAAILGAVARWTLLAAMVVVWLLGKRAMLFVLVIIGNVSDTLVLLLHAGGLASVLAGLSDSNVEELFLDVALMAASNVLIFSVWYWVIDPPGIDDVPHGGAQWAFLFPQRAGAVPNFADWQPGFGDYLLLAFTTSLAFSPTDTLPLTRTAKMLMLLQALISLITLTGIAGSAINILAGFRVPAAPHG